MAGPWEQYQNTDKGGPWSEYAAEPEPPALTMKQFQSQILERLRAGASPEDVRQWAGTVRNPEDPTGRVRYTIGPELEKAADFIARNPNVPINMADTTQGDPLGAAMRGAADVATFNWADEIQAGLTAPFSDRSYGDIADALRAQRAIDAQTNPTERFFGQAAGTIATAPMVPAKAFQGAGLLGNIGRAAGIGAGMSVASGTGAAQTADEAISNIPRYAVEGAALSAAVPAIGAGARGLVNTVGTVLDPEFAAKRALQESGLDAAQLQQKAVEFARVRGREPSLAELLTELEGQRFTGALAPSEAVRARVFDEANRLKRELGPELESRIYQGAPEAPPAGTYTMAPARDAIEGGATPQLAAEGRSVAVQSEARTNVARQSQEVGEPRRVIDGGDLFGEAVRDAGTTTRRPFERVAIKLPETVIPRVMTPGEFEREAKRFGDVAWGKFRDIPFRIGPEDRAYLDEFVLPYVSLPRATRERISRAYASDTMTIGDMDTIRRSLGAQANRGGAAKAGNIDYRDLRDDVVAMMGEAVPETTEAIRRYAGLMQAAEGARVGKMVGAAGGDLIEIVDKLANLSKSAKRGVAPGARASVVAQSLGNPAEAYKLASELETNTGFRRRFVAAVGPQEAQSLGDLAVSAKRGIDALFSMARIPPDKIPSALKTADGLVDVVAAGTLGAGGAFKANVIANILAKYNIGSRQAERLADFLLIPARRKDAILAIENLPAKGTKAKISRGAQQVIRAAFIRTASEIGKDNARLPENYLSTGDEQQ